MFKSPRVLEESELLNDPTECLESCHDINTNVKIIFPTCVLFHTLSNVSKRWDRHILFSRKERTVVL